MTEEETPVHRHLLAWLDSPRAIRTVQVVILITILAVAWLAFDKRRADNCLERYATAQAASNAALAKADAEANDAMEVLIRESLNGGPAYRAAANAWLAKYAEQKKARAEHPVLDDPAGFCD